jgi:hypothetical protein
MPLPRPSGPRVLWQDLQNFWRDRPRHQWVAAVLAILIPVGIVVAFYFDAQTNIAPGPQVIMVESWPQSRTDEEIKAKQKIDLRRREQAEERRRREFQRLDEAMNSIDRYGL